MNFSFIVLIRVTSLIYQRTFLYSGVCIVKAIL